LPLSCPHFDISFSRIIRITQMSKSKALYKSCNVFGFYTKKKKDSQNCIATIRQTYILELKLSTKIIFYYDMTIMIYSFSWIFTKNRYQYVWTNSHEILVYLCPWQKLKESTWYTRLLKLFDESDKNIRVLMWYLTKFYILYNHCWRYADWYNKPPK